MRDREPCSGGCHRGGHPRSAGEAGGAVPRHGESEASGEGLPILDRHPHVGHKRSVGKAQLGHASGGGGGRGLTAVAP